MANDPEEKQPSASSPNEPSAAKPPAASGEPASKPPVPPSATAVPPAVKPPAAPAPPRPPAPPKEGPVALDNELVKRYKEKFGPAILEAWVDRKQAILVVARELQQFFAALECPFAPVCANSSMNCAALTPPIYRSVSYAAESAARIATFVGHAYS